MKKYKANEQKYKAIYIMFTNVLHCKSQPVLPAVPQVKAELQTIQNKRISPQLSKTKAKQN